MRNVSRSYPMMYATTPSWIRRHTTPTFQFLTSTWRGVSYSKKKSERALVIWLFIFSSWADQKRGGSLSSTPWPPLLLLPLSCYSLLAKVLCLLTQVMSDALHEKCWSVGLPSLPPHSLSPYRVILLFIPLFFSIYSLFTSLHLFLCISTLSCFGLHAAHQIE